MKTIYLTRGDKAIIDDEDFERISQYNWHTEKYGNVCYAIRHKTISPKKSVWVAMHREILNISDSQMQVDHINHNGLDNRKVNLRLCTKTENTRYQQKSNRHTSSKFKGVCMVRGTKKWRVQIKVKGKTIWLGWFVSEIDAAKAYDEAAKKHFGEFACCNF